MTRSEVLRNIKLKEQFIKDNDLPITITDEPFFSQRLSALDPIYHSDALFNIFCNDLERYHAADKYFMERELQSAYISQLGVTQQNAVTSDYNAEVFRVSSLLEQQGDTNILHGRSHDQFYSEENDGKSFIRFSTDVYAALHHFSTGIFQGDSFEQFLDGYDQHLRMSVGFREDILNAIIGEERINHLTLMYLSIAAYSLESILGCKPYAYIDGGLIYELTTDGLTVEQLDNAINNMPDHIGDCLTYDIFQLHKLKSLGYMEERYGGAPYGVRFVDVDPNLIYQLVTYYNNMFPQLHYPQADNVDEVDTYGIYMDLMISYNGRLAKLSKPIKNPWAEDL